MESKKISITSRNKELWDVLNKILTIIVTLLIHHHRLYYSLFWEMRLVLVIFVSALTVSSYVADGTIKIIIKNFILTLKCVMSASKLKKINLLILTK